MTSRKYLPITRVDSAVVRLTPRARPLVASEDEERRVRGVIQALFQRRRQQLARSVREALGVARDDVAGLLEAVGIDPAARVEVLPPEGFVALARALGPRLAS